MPNFKIVTVNSENVDEFGFFCVKDEKHPGYAAKLEWLNERFNEGMRIKLIITKENQQAGFIEYTPGEYTWRIVKAPGYFVIHCIWVNSKKFPYKNMSAALLDECLKDAKTNGKEGVAVVTSDGSFMAGKEFYLKHGFEKVDEREPHYQLLIKRFGKKQLPSFPKNWNERLQQFDELQLIYTNQCPYIGKAINELPPMAEKHGVKLKLVELKNSAEAREKMVSPYGMINLVYKGKLLADHPISATRFKNILQKDLKLKEK